MRRAAKVDANHADIVSALERVGAIVQSLAAQGSGVPDLLVGYRGINYLIEVKDGSKPPSKRTLTSAQQDWHQQWRGQVAIVHSEDDALTVIGARKREAG